MVFQEVAAFSSGFKAGLTGKKLPGRNKIVVSGKEYLLKKKKKRKKK